MKTRAIGAVSIVVMMAALATVMQAYTDSKRPSAIFRVVVTEHGSDSDEDDWPSAAHVVTEFTEYLHVEALRHPTTCADWLMVGDDVVGRGQGSLNTSWDISAFHAALDEQMLPSIDAAAFPAAIERAIHDVSGMERSLPGKYTKVILILAADDRGFAMGTDLERCMEQEGITLLVLDWENAGVREFDALLGTLGPQNELDSCTEQYCSINE